MYERNYDTSFKKNPECKGRIAKIMPKFLNTAKGEDDTVL